ncbi:Pentatricopeptide repeat-containing protein [Artemisia annua]|uniref:Pentatricopeptide repeat-containing protein n=1 Tax=Artemisia annua TaxID=35608 RepID=A0A2U1MGM7_ARTAN|nr:Pentatricopeptide repeat-containing protein [Artemisia annua]
MLACGVSPNAYTYSVLVECLCGSGSGEWKMVKEGVKWFCEMMGKGIRPSDETSVAVFEGVVRCGKVDEGREVVRRVEEFGFGFDEKGVREVLKGKRGPVYRDVVDVMFGK